MLPKLPAPKLQLLQGGPVEGDNVIHLEKHFLVKQIRNRRALRPQPGALVLLRVFNPREPA